MPVVGVNKMLPYFGPPPVPLTWVWLKPRMSPLVFHPALSSLLPPTMSGPGLIIPKGTTGPGKYVSAARSAEERIDPLRELSAGGCNAPKSDQPYHCNAEKSTCSHLIRSRKKAFPQQLRPGSNR